MILNKVNLILTIVLAVGISTIISFDSMAFADIIPPKKQISMGISPEDVVCEDGMIKIIKEKSNSIACVKTNNASKLVSYGWAKSFDEKSLDVQISKENTPIGTINKLYTEPVKTQVGKIIPKSPALEYTFAFEVCAFSQKIYVPEVLIKSDSETQRYEIPDNVEPNSCIVSVAFISANDPNSIKATLLNKGDVSKILSYMEEKIASLQEELNLTKKMLGEKADPNTQQSSKIIEIRKQLNDAKEDLYRMYFTLYAVPKEKYDIQQLSFTGVPIEGELVNLIAAKKALSAENVYDVVFEACAGKNQIRLPVINIASDVEIINVKIGDKISPNTCQMTSAKILANNPGTIIVKPAGNAESNNKIVEIENQISTLQKEITKERESLRLLIHNPSKTPDITEKIETHSTKIIELRGQISVLKTELNKILYQTYR
ncbi:MAG: hypothetical protein ACE5R5_06210 [Nitrosarchaeum sp.]